MASYNHSYVFEMECDPPAYLWTGNGPLMIGGKTYVGTAAMIDLPDLRQLINGAADRIDITVSGIDEETLRLANEDRLTVPQSDARIGRIIFDEDLQVSDDIQWLWYGVADTMTINSASSEQGRIRTLKLGLGSADTRRSNPQIAFFTDADQRKRSRDDAFFSHVGQITAGKTREFGPK